MGRRIHPPFHHAGKGEKRMRKRRGWFVKNLLSYFVLAAVLLVGIGTLIIQNIRIMVASEITGSMKGALHSVTTVYEDWCWGMEEYAFQIKRDVRTSPYTLQGNGYAAMQVADELRKTVNYSGIYETIAIVYAPQVSAQPQRVYTSENTPEAQTFFSYHYRYDQWDLQDLYNDMPSILHPIMRAPEWVTVNRIARGRYITYIVPLCAATTVNQRGVMLYIVPVNRFLSMLDGVNIPDEATLIMADAAGRVVLSSGSLPVADGLLLPASPAGDAPVDFSVAGEKCQLLQTETGSGQWRFALLLPEHAVADVMQTRMRAIWLILGAGMVVAISASLGLSLWTFRPVKRLTGIAHAIQKAPNFHADEFEQIELTLTGLSKTNADLASRLHSQSSGLRQHILRSMCLGNMEQKDRFLSLLKEDSIPFDEAALRVVVVMIDHEDRLKAHMDNTMCVLIRYSLLKVLRETAHGCAMTSVGCEIGVDNSIVAVLSGDVEEMRVIRPVLEQVQQVGAEHFELTLTIGVSQCFEGLESIATGYRQAMEAAEQRFLVGCGQILTAAEEAAPSQGADIRRQLMRREARILGMLREEKYTEAVAQLDQYVEAIREMRLSPGTARQQFLLLRSSIYQQLHLLGEDTSAVDWMPTQQYQTLDSMRDAVAKVLYQLESKRQSTLSMQHSALIDQCVDYMQAHIADESLTIDSLAETLGISAGYLSRCFRAQMGSSPWQYFDGMRMRRACTLLKETDLRIQDILVACGYVDKTNFMRKFKNQYGMTPMEYRRASSAAMAADGGAPEEDGEE